MLHSLYLISLFWIIFLISSFWSFMETDNAWVSSTVWFCFWPVLMADLPVSKVNQFTSLRLNYSWYFHCFAPYLLTFVPFHHITVLTSFFHPIRVHLNLSYLLNHAGQEGWMIGEDWIIYRVLKYKPWKLSLLVWAWIQPCHILRMWPWANHLTFKPLFWSPKMRWIMVLTLLGTLGIKRLNWRIKMVTST